MSVHLGVLPPIPQSWLRYGWLPPNVPTENYYLWYGALNDNISFFHIPKMQFISIFCWSFRYLSVQMTWFQMYQNSEKHYWGRRASGLWGQSQFRIERNGQRGRANDKISAVVLCASERFRNTYTFVSQKLIFLYGVIFLPQDNNCYLAGVSQLAKPDCAVGSTFPH